MQEQRLDRDRFVVASRQGSGSVADDDWQWAIAQVLKAVVESPPRAVLLPRPPDRSTDHRQSLGYWSALHYLLVNRLGWGRPAKGLTWWIDAGRPLDDPTLSLVDQLWVRDGTLDDYLWWLIGNPLIFRSRTDDVLGPWAKVDERPQVTAEWLEWSSRYEVTQLPWGFSNGFDPLHLSGHASDASRDELATMTVVDAVHRTALFRGRELTCWPFELMWRMDELPDVAPNSWHVDVTVDGLGFLGEFRQSYKTGLPFSGKHSIHMRGN